MRRRGKLDLADLVGLARRLPSAIATRSRARKHRKQMQSAQRFAIADMPENEFGKLVGLVRPANKMLLEAPLSGRLCVYYEVYVDAMANGSMLRVLGSEQEGMRFFLEDGRSRALIDPANAMMSTGIDYVEKSTLYLMSDRQEALVKRRGLVGKRLAFVDGLRYREAILECDEKIAVFGGGVREPDPDALAGNYRDGDATRLCLSGSTRFPLFISDDPKATA